MKRAETGEVVQLAAVSENKVTPFQDSFHYLVEYPRISQAHIEVGGDALDLPFWCSYVSRLPFILLVVSIPSSSPDFHTVR